MKIARVTFLGVRGLADATFDLTDPATGEPHDVIVVTGPAAAGKTRAIEYFPATRRIPHHAPFHGTSASEQRLFRAGKDPRKYSFIPRFLQHLEDAPVTMGDAQAFSERLSTLSTTCRWERGRPSRAFTSRGGSKVAVAELSDGEADAVIFAATSVVVQLVRSIVLVDRPEMHVAPAEIPRVLAGLSALGRGNQIVLASSSPAVLAAANGAAVVRLEPAAG